MFVTLFVLTRMPPRTSVPCFRDDETQALRGKEVGLDYSVNEWLNQDSNSGLLPKLPLCTSLCSLVHGYIIKWGL